ncbi:uncharacterized protein LOC115620167 [Scaptodrosophila lebanonensis]|uniref:Uncharacterized protein LOC115620167 n=1 Tax=Drosophila lebanonensis TaxID=7225 RepID=A0A6J2SX47_DROLE|nr:uncharacterized protein LOC115620167 [Scaptodrosophila lebanonensis]
MYAMKATLCLSILALYMLPFTMGQGTTLAITLPDFPKLAVCIAPLRDLVLPLATKLIPLAAELYKCVDFKQETNPGYKLAVILKNTYNWSKKALLEKLSLRGNTG